MIDDRFYCGRRRAKYFASLRLLADDMLEAKSLACLLACFQTNVLITRANMSCPGGRASPGGDFIPVQGKLSIISKIQLAAFLMVELLPGYMLQPIYQ